MLARGMKGETGRLVSNIWRREVMGGTPTLAIVQGWPLALASSCRSLAVMSRARQ